jgi:hypothetical protein
MTFRNEAEGIEKPLDNEKIYPFNYGHEICIACGVKFGVNKRQNGEPLTRSVKSVGNSVRNTCTCCDHVWFTGIKEEEQLTRIPVRKILVVSVAIVIFACVCGIISLII